MWSATGTQEERQQQFQAVFGSGPMAKPLWKTKTFWVAVAAIVTTVGSIMCGELTWTQAIPVLFGAVGGITMRQGMKK